MPWLQRRCSRSAWGVLPGSSILAPSVVQAATTTYKFGSDETALSAGTYSVPVALKNASKHSTASNAAACFPSNATLTVNEDGTAKLTTELRSVTMTGLKDMAYNWKVYQTDGTTGDTVDATIEETTVAGDDLQCAGKTVPTKISFTIPDITWDGVYLNMWVDAMNTNPDAWLKIDYASAVASGTAVTKTGTAHIAQFGEYDVNVTVTLVDGKITNVAVEGDNWGGSKAAQNKGYLQEAIDGMVSKYVGYESNDAEGIYNIDAVSGATHSSEAIRDAVLNALGLTWEEEETINVPTSVEAGEYTVDIAYRTDVVDHSLVENKKATANLTVAEDGSMTLEFFPVNGTETEPLYMMDFNGYYTDNDTSKALLNGTDNGVEITKSDIDYSDDYFSEDTQVVTHIKMPLVGGLAAIYNTQTYLYVPAMNGLNGEMSGITFENGMFNVNSLIKVYWDSLENKYEAKIGDTNYENFADAVTAANSAEESSEIVLLKDVDDSSTTYNIEKSMTIDLNGYDLTAGTIQTSGASADVDLVLKDSKNKVGTLKSNVIGYNYKFNSSLKNNISIENVNMEGYMRAVYDGAYTIKNSKIKAETGNAVWDTNMTKGDVSFTIEDSEITAESGVAFYDASREAETTLTNSVLNGKAVAVYTINTVTIDKNTKFSGTEGAVLGNTDLPVGYKISETLTDGYYTVISTTTEENVADVAEIGSVKYASLADAFTEVKAGETITLLADASLKEKAEVSAEGVVLDLNGHELTVYPSGQLYGSPNAYSVQMMTEHSNGSSLYIKEGAGLEITDESQEKTGVLRAGIFLNYDIAVVSAGTLKISGVTLGGTNYNDNSADCMIGLDGTSGSISLEEVKTSEDNQINIISSGDNDTSSGKITIKNTEFSVGEKIGFIYYNSSKTADYEIEGCTVTDESKGVSFGPNTTIKDTTWKMTNSSCAGITFSAYTTGNTLTVNGSKITSAGSAALNFASGYTATFAENTIKAKNGVAVQISTQRLTDTFTFESGKYIGKDNSIKVNTAIDVNGGSYGGKVAGTVNCPEGKALVLQENGYYELDNASKAEEEDYAISFYDKDGNAVGGATEDQLSYPCLKLIDGSQMKLEKDISLTASMSIQTGTEGDAITLDLNGHTLDVAGYKVPIVVTNESVLTIIDSTDKGTLQLDSWGAIQVASGSVLNLNSGNYVFKDVIDDYNNGTINLNGGHYEVTKTIFNKNSKKVADITGGDYNIDLSSNTDSGFVNENCKVTEKDGRYYVESKYTFGSEKVNLAPGYYSIPLAMKKTDKVDDSMAAACVGDATLVVCEDGTAYIDLGLGKIDYMKKKGAADEWAVYQENSFADGTPAAFAYVVKSEDIEESTNTDDEANAYT